METAIDIISRRYSHNTRECPPLLALNSFTETVITMKTKDDLRKLLLSIDHRGYPAYKDTRGKWSYGNYILSIDHVQGDPFASPSNVSVIVPGRVARFPREYTAPGHRLITLQDMLLRLFDREIRGRERRRDGSGKSGLIDVSRPGQEVLERTACRVDPDSGDVTVRFEIGFPANGRSINARPLIQILEEFLPAAVSSSLLYQNIDHRKLLDAINLSDDQAYIRGVLNQNGLCAFVGDGSVLPRVSGVSSLPMKDAVPFVSPEALAVSLTLPHAGTMRGMGVRKGVTLIVGGGYHGKSTLLSALEKGVYDHIRGDGREYVITDESAVKVRAEDGRSITNVDISLFIRDLPNGRDTAGFSTEDASGSTSQAANVIESVQAGAKLLLIDEDTSATNFMVRDELMARVVSGDKEPITPFTDRVRELAERGVSTILVIGGSGEYLGPADRVYLMDDYRISDATACAKEIWHSTGGETETPPPCDWEVRRTLTGEGFSSYPEDSGTERLEANDMGFLLIGSERIDLRGIFSLMTEAQRTAAAFILRAVMVSHRPGPVDLAAEFDAVYERIRREGVHAVYTSFFTTMRLPMELPRRIDLEAAVSRMRRQRWR